MTIKAMKIPLKQFYFLSIAASSPVSTENGGGHGGRNGSPRTVFVTIHENEVTTKLLNNSGFSSPIVHLEKSPTNQNQPQNPILTSSSSALIENWGVLIGGLTGLEISCFFLDIPILSLDGFSEKSIMREMGPKNSILRTIDSKNSILIRLVERRSHYLS